ncbi:MAG: sulfatase-like hydrolase/transferase [Terrimonas sp.]|nr:sulfatase-like hydrolase/transferase [Terrimonas sp.]
MKRISILIGLAAMIAASCNDAKKEQKTKPNILVIYIDDLGYGDLSCYGATAVQTPHVDALAKGGMKFTDAHCSASTCTPSRYALLTGSYAFRSKAAILPGDAPLIIHPGQATLPSMLKDAGYVTGVIGKWHLGLGDGKPDWNTSIKPGPGEIGFDYSFLIPATPDRVPTVYVENSRVVNLDLKDPITIDYAHRVGNDPIGLEHPEMLKMQADSQHSGTIVNGISRIGFMKGGHQAYWRDEDFATVLNDQVTSFITQNKDKPFFLYYSLPSIHVPRSPNAKFVGATDMGPRGDDIVQMDWMTGEVMKTLKNLGLEANTLVIFSSDNGPVLNDGYADQAVQRLGDHRPAGIYKGGKYSAYEGGTRVPTITFWPGEIKQGESNALISQVDLFASLAQLVGQEVEPGKTVPDSKNVLPALLGQSMTGRETMVEESFTMSLRSGNWKYIAPAAGKTPEWLKNKDVPKGLQATPQLYNLEDDPGETHNLADQYPDEVQRLSGQLKEIMEE